MNLGQMCLLLLHLIFFSFLKETELFYLERFLLFITETWLLKVVAKSDPKWRISSYKVLHSAHFVCNADLKICENLRVRDLTWHFKTSNFSKVQYRTNKQEGKEGTLKGRQKMIGILFIMWQTRETQALGFSHQLNIYFLCRFVIQSFMNVQASCSVKMAHLQKLV